MFMFSWHGRRFSYGKTNLGQENKEKSKVKHMKALSDYYYNDNN